MTRREGSLSIAHGLTTEIRKAEPTLAHHQNHARLVAVEPQPCTCHRNSLELRVIRKISGVESGLAITYVHRVNCWNIIGLTLGGFLFLMGCESTDLQREQASQRTDISRLREKIEVLQSDVDSVQSENEGLRSEVSQLKKDLSTSRGTNAQYQKDIERLDALLKKLDTAREQDRKIIVEEVSQEISRLSKKLSNTSTTGKSQTAAQSVEQGVEHVVAKGETLYAIARAYGVTVKAIQDANQLTSNSLKTGQKLFIPQK